MDDRDGWEWVDLWVGNAIWAIMAVGFVAGAVCAIVWALS